MSFTGDWDAMGMRGTVSRDMLLENVFVPDDAEVLPPGLFGAMYNAFPHLFLSFSATFLGLMQAAYDGALAYLTGRMPGAPIPHAEIAAKGPAIAEMLFTLESARALYYLVNAGEKMHRRAGVKMHHGVMGGLVQAASPERRFPVRSKSLLSRPDLALRGRGAQRRGWEERSHAQQREHGDGHCVPIAIEEVAPNF